MIPVWFLKGAVPFTKTIERTPDGSIKKDSYPHLTNVTSIREEIGTLQAFFNTLRDHAAKGHCFLKGRLTREIENESRRGLMPPDEPTEILVVDIDGIASFKSVEEVLDHLDFLHADHIIQHSASSGLGGKISAHIFFLLEKPATPAFLKQWLMTLNLESEVLRGEIKLYRSKVAHSWPLDVSCAQNDKLIYIAPPVFKGMKDPIRERFQLVKSKSRTLELPTALPTLQSLKNRSRKLVGELRAAEGLPSVSVRMKNLPDGSEVATNVPPMTASDLFDCGDFWRLNINGGDSRGYWIGKADPRVLRNFKGEPNYFVDQVLPDLYAQLVAESRSHRTEESISKGFVDEVINHAGAIHSFYYDLETNEYTLTKLSGNTLWKHYLMDRGIPVQNYIISEWAFGFRPSESQQIDVENHFVNTFRETQYMRLAPLAKTPKIPRRIDAVVNHAVGPDMAGHFLNWLAVVFQKRRRTGTAWLLHGIHGTGKGVIFHKVLAPLFGLAALQISQYHYMSRFNGFLDNRLIVMIDEVDFSTNDEIMRDVMNKITERTITIEQKFSPIRVIPNYLNFILSANRLNPVSIATTDRRFSVGNRQEDPLSKVLPLFEVDRIEDELHDFAVYLNSYKADVEAAARPVASEAKEQMQILSASALDEVCEMLVKGKLEYFMLQYVDPMMVAGNRNSLARDYELLMAAVLADGSKDMNLSRDALRIIVGHCVGSNEAGESKFSRMLAHHGIMLKPLRPFNQHGLVRPCYPVTWKYSVEQRNEWLDVLQKRGDTTKPPKLRAAS